MDQYEKEILELAEELTELETGNIKSVAGIMNTVYNIVEETIRRNKNKEKLSVAFKKELSIKVLRNVVEILKSKELISENLYDLIIDNIDNENVELFIDLFEDINEIWESTISTGCLCFKKKKKNNIKKLKVKKINRNEI